MDLTFTFMIGHDLPTGQLLSFVKEFLAKAAADHGAILTLETVDFSAVLKHTARNYQDAAHRKQLAIHCELPAEPLRRL